MAGAAGATAPDTSLSFPLPAPYDRPPPDDEGHPTTELARFTLGPRIPPDAADWRLEHMLNRLEGPTVLRRIERHIREAVSETRLPDVIAALGTPQ